MKRTYDYLIAYNFERDGYISYGSGTIQAALKKKIKTFEDLNEVINFIVQSNKENQGIELKNVSIYNFILLGRNKH